MGGQPSPNKESRGLSYHYRVPVYKSAAHIVGHGLFTTNPQQTTTSMAHFIPSRIHRIMSSRRGVSTYEIETARTQFLQVKGSQDQQQILYKLIQQAGHTRGQMAYEILNNIVINPGWTSHLRKLRKAIKRHEVYIYGSEVEGYQRANWTHPLVFTNTRSLKITFQQVLPK